MSDACADVGLDENVCVAPMARCIVGFQVPGTPWFYVVVTDDSAYDRSSILHWDFDYSWATS